MSLRSSLEIFVIRPRSSIVLALLCFVIGIISISGLVPLSPNRKYFIGHEWFLASFSWLLAVIFGYCAIKGFSSRPNPTCTSSRARKKRAPYVKR